ncbi:uncharacterized protein C8A04DRAFT_27876 [Dichotomopilus funicola]|uniref:BZIP domain-containing protein n=1 Tax=Dichotomopilus funicola TaxID=1934379 RepID=A0AAN6V457_9PEZI|nr:hypothetical protein C8A04DRAFT_27876 [Dichotomopilus funicola]
MTQHLWVRPQGAETESMGFTPTAHDLQRNPPPTYPVTPPIIDRELGLNKDGEYPGRYHASHASTESFLQMSTTGPSDMFSTRVPGPQHALQPADWSPDLNHGSNSVAPEWPIPNSMSWVPGDPLATADEQGPPHGVLLPPSSSAVYPVASLSVGLPPTYEPIGWHGNQLPTQPQDEVVPASTYGGDSTVGEGGYGAPNIPWERMDGPQGIWHPTNQTDITSALLAEATIVPPAMAHAYSRNSESTLSNVTSPTTSSSTAAATTTPATTLTITTSSSPIPRRPKSKPNAPAIRPNRRSRTTSTTPTTSPAATSPFPSTSSSTNTNTNTPTAPPNPKPTTLVRNRAAATRYRAKTQAAAARLEADERAAEERNRTLVARVGELQDEVFRLKDEVLRHANCHCPLIDGYLAHAAEKAWLGLQRRDSAGVGSFGGSNFGGSEVSGGGEEAGDDEGDGDNAEKGLIQ